MSELDGNQLYIEGTVAYRSVNYTRDEGAIDNVGAGTPNDGVAANSGEATLSNVLASPFLGFVTDLGTENFRLGVGAYVPFGGQSSWDQDDTWNGTDYPGGVDGPQRWAAIEGTLRSLYTTTAVSYALPKYKLSFGGGVNVIKTQVDTIRARNGDGSDDLVKSNGDVLEGRALTKTSAWTWSVSAGVLWKPTEAIKIGASYQSQPGFGMVSQEGVLTTRFGNGGPTDTPVHLQFSQPDVFRLGAAYAASEKLELRLGFDLQRWSVMDKQCLVSLQVIDRKCAIDPNGGVDVANGGDGIVLNIQRDWQDTFGVAAGASYQWKKNVEITGGVLYDSNAVPDETLDPALMDMNKVSGNLGFDWQLNERFSLRFVAAAVYYLERTTAPRTVVPDAPSTNPDNAGTYKQFIGYGGIGLGVNL